MRFRDIRNALIQSWVDGDHGLPTAYPNRGADAALQSAQDNGQPWAAVFVVPSQPGVATLGDTGQDRHDGFLQIDLNYPAGSGDVAAYDKADEIARRYIAGTRFQAPNLGYAMVLDFERDELSIHAPLKVLIRSCGIAPPRDVEIWSRTSMTIYWSAWVSRGF